MRTVFLGTSEFAATVLTRLAGGPHRPVLVLTRPDRPSGRGRRLTPPPVAAAARALGLALTQPERVNEEPARAEIEAAAPEALVVCAFGALIREPLLSSHELLNVHPSLLPRWRGAAPIERAIMAGDAETGVCIMRLTAGLDSGPVALSAREPIAAEDTYGSLAPRLAELGGGLVGRALDELRDGGLGFVEQDEAAATYAEKIGPEDRLLDAGRPALELERVVRALHPHIGARLALGDGTALGVLRARIWAPDGESGGGGLAADGEGTPARDGEGTPARDGEDATRGPAVGGARPMPAAGELAEVAGRLLYGTREGALELLEVQPPGKRPMDAAAYLRGHGPRRA
ncbi:MAG TPA: methionyl-tRNA formyltransferase [Solirubrobacteraceae bacterium]|nr:methionyl-tRNA formyltransferase [Solirubrobacteraceae bacterium]